MCDVIGIGNSLLDLCTEVDEPFLADVNLNKSLSHMFDRETFEEILAKLKERTILKACGGAVANTIAALSMLGSSTGLFSTIGNDEEGEFIQREIKRMGIKSFLSKGMQNTGRVICLTTPDKERTFAGFLGAAQEMNEENIIEKEIKKAKMIHFTAYEFEGEATSRAVLKAAKIARDNNILVSFDLADPGVIQRNYMDLKEFVKEYVDILFANEEEAEEMTGKEAKKALEVMSDFVKTVAVKLGEKGSLLKSYGSTYTVPAQKAEVCNTSGAGDIYAAGILYGLLKNMPLEKAGMLASALSGKVVEKLGPRLTVEEVKNILREVSSM